MNEVDQKNGRIKYFPPSHFAYPFYIAKIPMFLDALGDKTCKKEDDINDIIEYYNVARYLEEGYLPPKLEEEGSLFRSWENLSTLTSGKSERINHLACFSLLTETSHVWGR